MSAIRPLAMPTPTSPLRCLWDAAASLGEGVCWSTRQQCVWWVDILGRRLHSFRPADGHRRSWAFSTEISAVAERAHHPGLIVTLRAGWAFFEPDAADGQPHELHSPEAEPASNRFNDGRCDRQGRFWAGTMDFACEAPTGALYAYEAGGRCVRHALGFAVTNGPTWSLDECTLYVNDTVNGVVHAFDFDAASGGLSNQRPWLRLAAGDGLPDGMTTDAAGRIWIAHWGGGCVSCHDPVSAQELGRIALPARHITHCAFGGPGLRTLFITSARNGLTAEQLAAQPQAGGLFAIDLSEGGLAPAMFGG